jgi:hypothetical protein
VDRVGARNFARRKITQRGRHGARIKPLYLVAFDPDQGMSGSTGNDLKEVRSSKLKDFDSPALPHLRGVPSENLIRWIRNRKENRIMIESDGNLLQTSARIYVGLLPFA